MDSNKHVLEMIGKGDKPETFLAESRYSAVNKYSIFPRVHEENSKDLYKDQKVCIVCKAKVSGVIDKKKYACMFCYNAVCQACSPLKCNNPLTLKEERTCMLCYFSTIESRVKSEMKTEIDMKIGDDEARSQKETLENELRDCEFEVNSLDIHIGAAEDEARRLETIKGRVKNEKERQIREVVEANNKEIEKSKDSLEKLQRDIANGREHLRKQEEEIYTAKRVLAEKLEKIKILQQEIEEQKKVEVTIVSDENVDSRNPDKEQCIDELNHLKSLISKLQVEQSDLQAKLSSQLKK